MSNGKLLIDFGSTFTKAVVVDLTSGDILARGKHYSTVDTDVTEGLRACLGQVQRELGRRTIGPIDTADALACSSAAGGLRMVCVGYVPDYSSQAANLAALGAGAKVVGCFSYEITRQEVAEIEALMPDILLLTGGTDGGNKKVLLHNATLLAERPLPRTTLIVAGNKTATDELRGILSGFGERAVFSKNVMPEVGRLEVDACNAKIREIFINTIVKAKGIGKAEAMIGPILMPTPLAVLKATHLLVDGVGDEPGIGEAMVVDVGGATTDVHSVARAKPAAGVVAQIGLPEPYEKRTVEGDLGLKFNLDRLEQLLHEKDPVADVAPIIARFKAHGFIPMDPNDSHWHTRLSRLAVETAVERHVGRIEVKYGPTGEMLLQYGKDFTNVPNVIGTGGPVIFATHPRQVLEGALFRAEAGHMLKPKAPRFFLDSDYILYAGGLLGQRHPVQALHFMKKHLTLL